MVLDDGMVDRVELTRMVDNATRSIPAAVLRPTTKAVDASLLLARALTLNRCVRDGLMRCRMSRSALPHHSMTDVDKTFGRCCGAAGDRPGDRSSAITAKRICPRRFGKRAARWASICSRPIRTARRTNRRSNAHCSRWAPCSHSTWPGMWFPRWNGEARNAEQDAVWSMVELQALLDEWIIAVWQNRPHDGLRDPVTLVRR